MTEVPKIVHHRLRAAMPAAELLEQMHPEADVLTAFAEQALSAPEREGVLQHLALCGDCRDVVALALPATDLLPTDAIVRPQEEVGEEESIVTVLAGTEAVTRSGNREGKSRFAWAGFGWGQMRWATLAAGIAVAIFVVRPALEHIGKPHPQVNSAANQISPAVQPTSTLQTASGEVPVNSAVATKNVVTGAASSTPMDSKNKVKINSVEPLTGANMTGANMTSANMRGADTSLANTIGGLDGRSVSSPPPQPPQMTASRSEQSGMQLVGTLGANGGSVKQNADRLKADRVKDRVKKDAVSAGLAGAPRRELGTPGAESKSETEKAALGKSVVASSSTMVEVSGASTEVETTAESGSTSVSPEANLMAQADQPPRERTTLQDAPAIVKAKPALDDSATRDAAVTAANESGKTSAGKTSTSTSTEVASLQAEVTPKAKTRNFAMQAAAPLAMQKQNANWTIADGALQRSLDGGHTWQMAARAEHALLCYANRGQEVWAGGQAGTLLHSVDNGATWSAVAVAVGGQQLSSDVTRLDIRLTLRPTVEIVLSTDTHETWSSMDGGKTWEKK